MSQLRRYEQELASLNTQVAVVTFQSGPLVEAYVRETNSPWPVLVDDALTLYSEYGMHHGRWRDLLGPAAMGVYAKLMLRGRRPRRASGDIRQLGGDVLVDPDGVVRLHHVGRGPADRPSVESILDCIRRSPPGD